MKYRVKFILNNEEVEHYVEANKTLLKMLREDFNLTSAKEGCGAGECGACTVIMNGKPVNACLVLAPEANESTILTVEGLSDGKTLDDLQVAFVERGAIQCGYCTPGMIMMAKALLDRKANPTEEEVKEAISGNLCRCTGYKKIIEAIMDIAEKNVN
ncbi:(2Fe-2S)-binding protein [Maledivibacter halophilus]|uniref:Carbon-monoxide dehydrogenase small subunit n=1 Tax=Maledivibacter halophilus TaxID=36842 RepID=A0A1T5ITD5_9FIRM|nr:(2Fe-2S)-binding protein [Maledivibacter halophilus]SKC42431.1 carbon-monoxide dehydrogenase small subunit [Maledivibacter halophilus]